MAEPRDFVVPDELAGERVDKAVAVLFGLSRAVARGMVDEGVAIDGVLVGASDRVAAGAVLRATPPDPAAEMAPEEVDFDVIYEDEHLLVVDKPSGLVVHPGRGRTTGTLAAGLLHRYPEIEGVGDPGRWGIVHRLDRDTSGVLLVARTREAHNALSGLMRRREITRVYVALVHGRMAAPTGIIDAPIGRDPASPLRRAAHAEGKPARTHYQVSEVFGECSLLEVRLETGRTHQIRVHMAAIDHPVVGDALYAGRRHRFGATRMFLHASRLELTHPMTGESLSVVSPLPEDLAEVLQGLSPDDSSNPIP